MLSIGSQAPQFSLQDQNGNTRSLRDERGRWVVVYFYPKDDTPGCTKEACAFRDMMTDFLGKNVRIFGISKDDVTSHGAFAKKHALNFSLLADPEGKTIGEYGGWGQKLSMGVMKMGILRVSYLIDPEGKVAKTYARVTPEDHAQEILHDIESLS